jgi:ankyrin repeat protein
MQALKKLKSTSPKYVKQALDALPATLDDTYTRALLDIEEMYHDHALRLLQWLAYAHSPPTLGELVEAAVTNPDHESSIDADDRGDLDDTLNILSGLVTVEESKDADVEGHSKTRSFTPSASTTDHDKTVVASQSRNITSDTRVRLAHFSVKGYLESKRILKSSADQFYLESATAHRALSQSCLTYLRYYSISPGKTLTEQDLETFPLLKYAAQSWFYHSALQYGGEISREISFLHSEQGKHDWLLVYDPHKPWEKPFKGHEDEEKVAGSAIYYASLLGLPAVVTSLLGSRADANVVGGLYGNALQAASAEDHKEIVQLLLDNKANVNAVGGYYGNALQVASARDHKETVQLLLDNEANVNAVGGYYSNALQAASAEGHKEIVQLLLDNKANINAEGGYYGNALQDAPARGHTEIIQLLLDKEAKINAEGGYYNNALQYASARGHKEIVQLLLDNEANVNAEGGLYGNALQAASARGRKGIVQLLLDNKANVNAEGGLYGNALQAASAEGHKEIVQLLLDNKANINAEDGQYGNALQAAIAGGHEGIIQLLLDKRANANAEGGEYGSAVKDA